MSGVTNTKPEIDVEGASDDGKVNESDEIIGVSCEKNASPSAVKFAGEYIPMNRALGPFQS